MPSASPPSPHGFFRRHALKFVASAIITAGILLAVHKGGLKILPEGGDFHQVRWWTLPLYLVTLCVMQWFRCVRWRFLLRKIAVVPRRRLFAVSSIGIAAILLMPFRIGEVVRPYLIRTPPNEREANDNVITLTAATSSIVAERILDGLYLGIVLALALVFVPTVHPLPDRVIGIPVSVAQVRMSGFAMLAAFVVLFASIAVYYFARAWAHATTVAVVGKISLRLAEKLSATFEKFADGLHVLGRWKDALGFLGESSLYWGANATGMWLLAWGCGVHNAAGGAPTFGEACAMMGMLGCAVLIPGPPGLLGVFQAGLYAGMTMFYPTHVVTAEGAAFVFLTYASQFIFTVLMGGVGLVLERGEIRELERAEGLLTAAADAP
jgi:glycosyltransferase 2 family protein